MAELGQIHPEKKIACPHCNSPLSEDIVNALASDEIIDSGGGVPCDSCGQLVRLPQNVINRLRGSRHLGKSFDITA